MLFSSSRDTRLLCRRSRWWRWRIRLRQSREQWGTNIIHVKAQNNYEKPLVEDKGTWGLNPKSINFSARVPLLKTPFSNVWILFWALQFCKPIQDVFQEKHHSCQVYSNFYTKVLQDWTTYCCLCMAGIIGILCLCWCAFKEVKKWSAFCVSEGLMLSTELRLGVHCMYAFMLEI